MSTAEPLVREGPAHRIPDYENYDFSAAWDGRSIQDLAERRLVAGWARTGGESCLDLGGGFGRITQVLEPLYQKVFMLDYSSRNLRGASTRLRKTTLVRCELGYLPFEDDTFDFISLIRVSHHISNPSPLLEEISRVGRNNSVFVMSVPNPAIGWGTKGRREGGTTVGIGPQGHLIYPTQLARYSNLSLLREEIRGVGLFDNRLGVKFERLAPLSLIDVKTSRLWPLKTNLFLRFTVKKYGAPKNEPRVLCNCGGAIVRYRCEKCQRPYGQVIDLVEGGESPRDRPRTG